MVLRHLVSPRPELGASCFKDSFETFAREIPSAKEPMVDVQTDLFFCRHLRLLEQNRMFFRFVWQRTNPSVHQPLVLWQTDFNMLKSIFEASDPSNASILTMNKNQWF
jgi:hypothetical protein